LFDNCHRFLRQSFSRQFFSATLDFLRQHKSKKFDPLRRGTALHYPFHQHVSAEQGDLVPILPNMIFLILPIFVRFSHKYV
jgi:hypothetical protein